MHYWGLFLLNLFAWTYTAKPMQDIISRRKICSSSAWREWERWQGTLWKKCAPKECENQRVLKVKTRPCPRLTVWLVIISYQKFLYLGNGNLLKNILFALNPSSETQDALNLARSIPQTIEVVSSSSRALPSTHFSLECVRCEYLCQVLTR